MTLRKILEEWGQHTANFGPLGGLLDEEWVGRRTNMGQEYTCELDFVEPFGKYSVKVERHLHYYVIFIYDGVTFLRLDRNTGDILIPTSKERTRRGWSKIPTDCMLKEVDFQLLPLLYPGAGNAWDMIKCLLQKYYWCRMPDE